MKLINQWGVDSSKWPPVIWYSFRTPSNGWNCLQISQRYSQYIFLSSFLLFIGYMNSDIYLMINVVFFPRDRFFISRVFNHSNSLLFYSSRPGRPPKRAPVGLSLAASHLQQQQIKKHRLDNGDYPYENGHMGGEYLNLIWNWNWKNETIYFRRSFVFRNKTKFNKHTLIINVKLGFNGKRKFCNFIFYTLWV